MKGVIGLIIFLSIGGFVASSYWSREWTKDQGHQLSMAFGVPTGDEIQVHMGVGTRLVMLDPRTEDENGNQESWSEWIAAHYELRDAGGNLVELKRIGTSGLLEGELAAGAPEFAIWANVKQGATYTWDFTHLRSENNQYRCTFTVPQQEEKVRRYHFEHYEPEEE